MKTLNEIEEYLKGKLEDHQNEIQECETNINQLEQAIEQANKVLIESEETVDVEGYNKAKNDIWSGQHTKELYQKQLEKIKSKRLVSEEEYRAITQAILLISNENNEKQLEDASELIAEIKIIANQSSNMVNQATNLLKTLQDQVYKISAIQKTANGGTLAITLPTVNLDTTVNGFYQSRIKGSKLSQMVGEEQVKNYTNWLYK